MTGGTPEPAPAPASGQLATDRLPHLPALDGLRAIAVGLVFIGHSHLLPRFPASFGVTLFFFLSGYLITTLLRLEQANHGAVNLRHFYLRRLLRINPPLYVTLALIALLLAMGLNHQPPTALGVVSQLFFFSNYLPDHGMTSGLQSPLWSLAVEEHFYLVFPGLFVLAMRKGTSARLAAWCAVACAAVLAVRLVDVALLGIVGQNGYWTHTRMDSILYGCILALWSSPAIERSPPWRAGHVQALLALAAILGTFVFPTPLLREGLRYTVQGLALLVLFNWLLQGRPWLDPLLCNPVAQRLGLWSYSFYLLHYAMLAAFGSSPASPSLIGSLLAIPATALACEVIHRLIERPAARLRRRLAD